MGSSWDHAEPLLSDQRGLRSISSPGGGEKERLRRRQLAAVGEHLQELPKQGPLHCCQPCAAHPVQFLSLFRSSPSPYSFSIPQTFPIIHPSFLS